MINEMDPFLHWGAGIVLAWFCTGNTLTWAADWTLECLSITTEKIPAVQTSGPSFERLAFSGAADLRHVAGRADEEKLKSNNRLKGISDPEGILDRLPIDVTGTQIPTQ
ncbi:hypothetical protein K438DRAFT_1761037 [Mycena galopus ATCC 62051]|nr:hypothetical protein K438DRAFT_1761037 [Mycena galopus ATCC 62051]